MTTVWSDAQVSPGETAMHSAEPLPAKRAVVAIENDQGQTISLSVTRDVSRHIKDRIDRIRQASDEPLQLRIGPVGSDFEADLVWLSEARRRFPDSYRGMIDRWRAWFVEFDWKSPTPAIRKTNLGEFAGSDETPSAKAIVGPIRDKNSAGKYRDMLIDLFELCRFPRELAKAPQGHACAYKEIGRCPAACDGSEPMGAYRKRMRDAVQFAQSPIDIARANYEDHMRRCSESNDFEGAKAWHQRLETCGIAAKPACRHVSTLDRFRWLVLSASRTEGNLEAFLCEGGTVRHLRTLAPTEGDWKQLCADVRSATTVAIEFRRSQVETLGLVAFHLLRPKSGILGVRIESGTNPPYPGLRRLMSVVKLSHPSASAAESEDLFLEQ